jgi:FdhD protein
MTENETYKTVRSFTFRDGIISPEPTDLLVETPLEISIDQGTQTLIMFTPEQIRELVFGFLFTEGMIETPSDVRECRIQSREPGDQDEVIEAHVTLKVPLVQTSTGPDKRMSFSSCGVCGKQNYGELNRSLKRVGSRHRFPMGVVEACAVRLEAYQKLYWRTGGAHAAMLLDGKAEAVFFSEDMGRHNAVDKVIGAAILKDVPMDDKIIISSGRASLEMILKTARAGIPVFVAMSRPTSRAVDAAKLYNVTLIDLAKYSNRIHSHVRRIEGF